MMAAQLKTVDPKKKDVDDMLDLLDHLRKRVESGELQALVAVEIPTSIKPVMSHTAGDIYYATVIGHLAQAAMELHLKSSGIIEP